MLFAILLLLFATLLLVLSDKLHHICLLEVSDRSAAHLLLDGRGIRLADVVLAIFRGHIRVRLCQELDPDISMDREEYRTANTSHPPGSLTQDWEAVTDAAIFSTKQIIQHFKDHSNPDEEINLYLFIQSVILSTYLRLFFSLPATPTNIEDVVWIVGKTWKTPKRQKGSMSSPELSRLVKPSPNPRGVFALLSVTQRLVLAAMCTLERKGEKIPFLRQAGALLRHPISPEPGLAQLVEEVKRLNPPVQFVRGGLSLPRSNSCSADFIIPTDLLPPSPCVPGPDGSCSSWLHKAALPDQPACDSGEWLIRATTIILSAIETEIRQANLTVDGDEQGTEAWEDWVLRRSRV